MPLSLFAITARRLTLFAAVTALGTAAPGIARAQAPQPFIATYDASYRGIEAGTLKFVFARDAATGHYTYDSTANPSLLARLVVGRDAHERSVMSIGPDGVRPLQWQLEDGKSATRGDGTLRFDWNTNRVTGRAEDKAIDLPAEPGVQDRLSIQIAVVAALLRGTEPGTVSMIDDNRIKHYVYTRRGAATLDTKLGKLETVIYESTREGSNRVSKFWLVPSLEYVAARAEQIRKGKVETVMVLTALTRGQQ